jgi:hypothetical protein
MRTSNARPIAVASTATVVAAYLAHHLLGGLLAPVPQPITFDDLLLRSCSAALLVCTAWAWAAVLACVIDAVREHTGEPRLGMPAGLRRLVLLACGVTLATTASPALATSDLGHDPAAHIQELVAGLTLPDRTTDIDPDRPHRVSTPASRTVRVRAGDSLWTITDHLFPQADTGDVARGWHELYDANRDVIGADPSTIRPGMILEIPRTLRARSAR